MIKKIISPKDVGLIRTKRIIDTNSWLNDPSKVKISDYLAKSIDTTQEENSQRVASESPRSHLQIRDSSNEFQEDSTTGDYSP